MRIFVRIKLPGKREAVLPAKPYEIPNGITSLRELLAAIAEQEAAAYNQKEPGAQQIPFLTQAGLDALAETGKVGFGRIYGDKKADPPKAAATAVACWEDGLVRVLLGDRELTALDASLEIPENSVFTFLRLTFLTGGMW